METKELQQNFISPSLKNIDVPRFWDPKDKCKYLLLDDNKLKVSYKGIGKYDTDAAAVRTNCAIPPSCGIFYFEINIISKGRDGHIGIGVSSPAAPLSRLPGWDPHSYGYHADDGFLFRGSGGEEYGPTFTTGDTIGCCINFRNNTVSYTKNGLSLGIAFTGILNEPLHPTVGLRTPGEIIEANFGQNEFIFDVSSEIQKQQYEVIKSSFNEQKLSKLQIKIPEMILQYLIHYGYSRTAHIFAKSILNTPTEESLASIAQRQDIISYIINGDIDKAILTMEKHHMDCLNSRKDIKFKLTYYRFIQMVKNESPEETIKFGRKEFSFDNPLVIEHQDILEDIFSLLAYTNPLDSPVSYLFSVSFREKLAEDVNSAILEYYGQSCTSTLERCLSHNKVLLNSMIENDIPAAALYDTSWLLSNQTSNNNTNNMDIS